uniref:Putative ovule protein n=2 Tax=Solanum chacoense TaxID=4108 RepID=A0A0V0H9L3_SOLCH
MLEVSSSKPLARQGGLPSGSSSSHWACLVWVMWFASYCIRAGVLPCVHLKGSGCGFPLSSKKIKKKLNL